MQQNCRPKVVLLTGEIGSGKTSVRQMFEKRGVPCTDADAIARAIQSTKGHDCLEELDLVFPGCLTVDGVLNRPMIRDIIAKNPLANGWLKEIMTPHVMQYLDEWTVTQNTLFVIWESALIPYGAEGVDFTLMVVANRDEQVARIRLRNPDWTEDQIEGILKQQQASMYRSNGVIFNRGTFDELDWEVNELYHGYMRAWERTWLADDQTELP